MARVAARVTPGFAWRWGLKSAYGWEQFTFWLHLHKRLVDGRFDILHVQDPMLAFWCRRARLAGRIATTEILAHGTEEPADVLAQFECVQHLAPWHLEQSLQALQPAQALLAGQAEQDQGSRDAEHPTPHTRHAPRDAGLQTSALWVAIPNFVDTNVFRPATGVDEQAALRRRFGIPADAFVVGTAAAIKRHHKRIDYLVREFAGLEGRMGDADAHVAAGASRWKEHRGCHPHAVPHLVIAGASCPDTEELKALAQDLAPNRVTFLLNVPHCDMPDLLRCYDVFVLTSLFEMMPIALLEAIATGLPVLTQDHPVLEWMAGEGGRRIDMSADGSLASALADLTPADMATLSAAARARAVTMFAKDVVIDQYLEYYQRVMESL